VTLDRVNDYVNRRVVVESVVGDVRRQPNGEVWLSLGRPYPKGRLVVVIPREMLGGHPDYANYSGKVVRVTGMVRPSFVQEDPETPSQSRTRQTYPTKPSIVIDNPQRLVLVPPEPEP
jgi:hypothetical protein